MNVSHLYKIICTTSLLAVALFGSTQTLWAHTPSNSIKEHTMHLTQDWDKTFPKSTKVDHKKVTFKNRYGITLAADLYLPKNLGEQKWPAIVVGGPFGGVKERQRVYMRKYLPSKVLSPLPLTHRLMEKAAASRAMSLHLKYSPRILARWLITLACNHLSIASA